MKKVIIKKGIPKEVSAKWFDRLVENSMMMPLVLRRMARLERRIQKLYYNQKGKKTILVWRNTGGLGDIVMHSVIARRLKEKYPRSYIIYQVPEEYMVIPQHNPYVDKVQVVESPFIDGGFDITVKLSNPCPAAVYESIKEPNIMKHRIDLFLEAAGLDGGDRRLIYWVEDDEKRKAEEFLKEKKALEGIKIGFELRSAENRRDWKDWRKLAELIKKEIKNSKIFIFDHDPKSAWKNGAINVCGWKIEDMTPIVQKLDLLICPDSGLTHLAGALGTKILGLFGPTNPLMRLNSYNADWIWLEKTCKKCPCWYIFPCGGSKCIDAITPKMVLDKVKKVLKNV